METQSPERLLPKLVISIERQMSDSLSGMTATQACKITSKEY